MAICVNSGAREMSYYDSLVLVKEAACIEQASSAKGKRNDKKTHTRHHTTVHISIGEQTQRESRRRYD